jgi:hypothetical protein
MSHHWDELSKSLATESLPRRESLRRIGAVLAGAVLSPLGLGTAWARGPDPCKAFCNQCPKSRRSQCLAACEACDRDTSRLCGSCGAYACCGWPGPYENGACINGRCEYWCVDGADYCDGTCSFLDSDPDNCGACGHVCDGFEYCVGGVCQSNCIPYCPPGWCGDDGCGGRCPCTGIGEYCPAYSNWCAISQPCDDCF